MRHQWVWAANKSTSIRMEGKTSETKKKTPKMFGNIKTYAWENQLKTDWNIEEQ